MTGEYPGILRMTRVNFSSCILAPLVYGTLLACYVSRSFAPLNLLLVLIIGVCLQVACAVYNDIYDTKQGADEANLNRNQFSGGSGVLQQYPELMPKMYFLARAALAIALAGTGVLTFLIEPSLWITLWVVILVSVVLSKYYTAAPVKLANAARTRKYIFGINSGYCCRTPDPPLNWLRLRLASSAPCFVS